MSDKLSILLERAIEWKSPKSDDPNQRIIDALSRALKATTPTHAGTPWDMPEEEFSNSEIRISEGE